ncbi:hypothetical protein FH972_026251 [Carpinus fangiana]|uniref:Dynamin-type G domain-containing protein n=1 Tax=Carpinus fangiana TaxID=176857 RepID=A0A5N6L3L6_9ROSI|nr:hypothetical protein FH972_026251 [Carpinus fangiana]
MNDQPTSSPSEDGFQSEHDRRAMATHIHQLQYNHNRTALGRAIARTIKTLQELQEENQKWPAHYPSVQQPAQPSHIDHRPGLVHTQSTRDHATRNPMATRPGPRRAGTSLAMPIDAGEGSSNSKEDPRAPQNEPRLVTAQLARDFSVLKIDLKMDGMPQTDIIHSMRKDSKALARLLDGQINKSVRHLGLLRERIEDTSSKVLVTGDLNAGKSTFCNALLRRKILPEDEQPCTSIFCEVLDVRDNGGIEEVHAIPVGTTYDRNDERTFKAFPLNKLETIVTDSENYSQCKVYVKDIRSVDESLLNNGVLDIALIDAPGLNNDSIKTTAVFARQEEIDVVVFVVSAANHFTLSAREFIYDAAREKAFMFMVVNGFDTIKNKKRCQEQILKQVHHLSPATFKESSELVHFVSSNAVPVAPIEGGPGGPGGSGGFSEGGSGAGESSAGNPWGDPDDDNDNDDNDEDEGEGESSGKGKGKGKDREKMRDFEELEASLRRFVLEKRARSKLAPAKTYLLNVLEDVNSLASCNRDVAQAELDRVTKELKELEPVLEQSKKARNEARDDMDRATEDSAADVYTHTRDTLDNTIADVSERDLGVPFPGFWDAYTFAEDITAAMLREITATVDSCEDYARMKTAEGVNSIKSLGILHLGDDYMDLKFQPDNMLRRRKDALARRVDLSVDLWDFFDVNSLWERQEKVAGTSMAVTVAGVLGTRMIGGVGWVDGALSASRVLGSNNLRRLFIPGLLLAAALGISYAIASIPQSLPRRLSVKLSTQLATMDFTHSNALRISSEVRKALKIPADNLRVGLQRNFEELQNKQAETTRVMSESEVARKYFGNLVRNSAEIKQGVDRVDLEGPAPGIAGGYDL